MTQVSISEDHGCLENNLVRVEWDTGGWTIQWPQYQAHMDKAVATIAIDEMVETVAPPDWQCKLETIKLNDALGESPALSGIFTRDDLEVTVAARIVPTQSSVVFAAKVRNLGNTRITIRELSVLNKGTRLDLGELGEGEEAVAVCAGCETQSSTDIVRLVDTQICRGICMAYNPVSDLGFVCANVSFRNDNTITIALAGSHLKLQGKASMLIEIEPGESYEYDNLLVDCRPSPLDAMESYADVVKTVNDPPLPDEIPVGWCSWYGYRLTMTEDIVLQNAEVVARHFRKYGVKVILLDHGWQYQDIPGVWTPNEKFPHRLQWLCSKLAGMGLELGLWVAPADVSEFAPLIKDTPEALVVDSDGKPVVGDQRWTWPPHGKGYVIDPMREAGQQFLHDLAETINSSGATYVKADFVCRWGDGERLRTGMRILREKLNDNILLKGGTSALYPQLGIVQEMSIASDIGNATGDWAHLRVVTLRTAAKWFMNNKFWVNSGYPIVGDPEETLGEAIGRTTFLALKGGSVMLSDRLPELEKQPERLKLIPLYLPPSGIAARPIDLFRVGESGRDYPRIWQLHAGRDWGSWEVVGLFNWSEQPLEEEVAFADLGLRDGAEYLVFDFWTQTLVGRFTESCQVVIPAGSARCLRIVAVPDHPIVVGTDMHVTQGLVDLDDVAWDERGLTLSGEAVRAPGAEGTIFIYVPTSLSLADASTAEMIGPQCAALKVDFTKTRRSWHLTFARGDSHEVLPLNAEDSILKNPMREWANR